MESTGRRIASQLGFARRLLFTTRSAQPRPENLCINSCMARRTRQYPSSPLQQERPRHDDRTYERMEEKWCGYRYSGRRCSFCQLCHHRRFQGMRQSPGRSSDMARSRRDRSGQGTRCTSYGNAPCMVYAGNPSRHSGWHLYHRFGSSQRTGSSSQDSASGSLRRSSSITRSEGSKVPSRLLATTLFREPLLPSRTLE